MTSGDAGATRPTNRSIGPLSGHAAANPSAATQIKTWTRDLLQLGDDVTVMVSELACSEQGCPPLETVIATLTPGATSKATIHKPLAEVTSADVAAAFTTDHG